MNLDESHATDRIDLMEWDDLDAVVRLERESFSTPWPKNSFENSIDHPDVDALVVRSAGSVQGFLVAAQKGNEYLIANVAVGKKYRRRGLASKLIVKALSLGEGRGAGYAVLDVRESNQAAILLYEGLGFHCVQKALGYYSCPPEDALIMVRNLRE